MDPLTNDIGHLITGVRAAAVTSATAGGSGDNTLVTGTVIDLLSTTLFPQGRPKSCKVLLPYTTTLASAETLTLGSVLLEHSSDNSTFATLGTVASGTVSTGGSGGTTNTGIYQGLSVNLEGANRYVRIKFTPNLSASGTDTAQIAAVAVFGGFPRPPVS